MELCALWKRGTFMDPNAHTQHVDVRAGRVDDTGGVSFLQTGADVVTGPNLARHA